MSATHAAAFRFFYDNAGHSQMPGETERQGRTRGAIRLLLAEAALKSGPYFISLEADPEGWDADVPWDGPVWIVSLWHVRNTDKPVLMDSVGGVGANEDDPYLRVVAAELAAEKLPAPTQSDVEVVEAWLTAHGWLTA